MNSETNKVSFLQVFTLTLWLVAAVISVVGILVPYGRPVPSKKQDVAIVTQKIEVQLTSDPLPTPPADVPKLSEPPPLATPAQPNLSPVSATPVADPSVVAFAMPVPGPVTIVQAKQAAYVAPVAPVENVTSAPAPVTPTVLVYGQGEGRQPAPEYPFRARRDGQEGVVKIRFAVGESGKVASAEIASASPWSLLNQSAVKTVRERWQFQPGPMRLYEVAIRFELSN